MDMMHTNFRKSQQFSGLHSHYEVILCRDCHMQATAWHAWSKKVVTCQLGKLTLTLMLYSPIEKKISQARKKDLHMLSPTV